MTAVDDPAMVEYLERVARLTLEPSRKLGRKTISAGDVISIAGYGYARTTITIDGQVGQVKGWKVLGFRGREVHVFGGVSSTRAPAVRVFDVERIRPRRT